MSKGLITIYDSTDSTYLLVLNPAKTSYVYNKDGSIVNEKDTLGVYSFTMYEDGVDITNKPGMEIKWSTPLAMTMLTGSGVGKTFEPGLVNEFNISRSNNNIDLRVLYNGVTLKANQPVSITKVSENGNDGVNAKFVWVSPSSSVIRYDKENKNPVPNEIIITANTQNLNTKKVEWFEIKSDGTTVKKITAEDGVQFIGGEFVQNPKIKFTPDAKLWGGKNVLYIKVLIDGIEDSTSVAKLRDGADGQTGRSYRNRGTWQSGTVYGNDEKYVDTVRYEGSLYECIKTTNPGIKPSDERYWFLLVEKGDAGPALDWIKDWDGKKVTIGGSSIVAPKIFLGQNSAGEGESPILSGVAIGTDVNGSFDSTIGIVGYNENIPNFQMQTNGAVWFGRDTKRRLTIKDDGTLITPDITADTIKGGTLKVGGALRDITGNEGVSNANGKILVFDSNQNVDTVNDDQAIVTIDAKGIAMKKGKIKGEKTLIDVTDGDFFIGEFKTDGTTPDTTKAHLRYTIVNGKPKLTVKATEINFSSEEGGGGITDKFTDLEQKFEDLANDSLVTPSEKSQLARQLIEINKEHETIVLQALEILANDNEILVSFGVSHGTLVTYLTDLLADRNNNTNIDRNLYISNFNNYYIQRGLVNKEITKAHIEGDAANKKLIDDIANDSIVTPSEKSILAREFAQISGEYNSTLAHAVSVGLASVNIEVHNYTTAYNFLNEYLNGANGLLANMDQNTTLTNPDEIKNLFGTYYNNKAILLNAITSKQTSNTASSISAATAVVQKQLDNMAIDGSITPIEKTSLRKQLNELAIEKNGVIEQSKQGIYQGSTESNNKDVDIINLNTAFDNLNSYLLNTVKIESEKNTTTEVNTVAFKQKFSDYFSKRDVVIVKVSKEHKNDIEISKGNIKDIGSDKKITPGEKVELDRKFQEFTREKDELIKQAAHYGITTGTYTTAYNALDTYLYTTPGILKDKTITTTLDGVDEFNGKFNSYYTAKASLMTAIIGGTKTHSTDIQKQLNEAIQEVDRKANAAEQILNSIFADNEVTPVEKAALEAQFNLLDADYRALKTNANNFFVNVVPPETQVGTWVKGGGAVFSGGTAQFWNDSRSDINFTYPHFNKTHPDYQGHIDAFVLAYEGNSTTVGLEDVIKRILGTSGTVTIDKADLDSKFSNYYTKQKSLLGVMSTVEHNIKSSFTQTSDGIDMIVGSSNIQNGEWNADTLLSKINITPGNIKLSAAKVQIEGELTLSGFMSGEAGNTVINGGTIKTGTLTLGGNGVNKAALQIRNSSNVIVTNMNLNGIATTGKFVVGNTNPDAATTDVYNLRFDGKNLDVKLNNASIEAASKINLSSSGVINVTSGSSLNVNASGNMNIQGGGRLNVKSTGTMTIESGGNININGGGNLNIKSNGRVSIESGGNFTVSSGGNFSLTANNVSLTNSAFRLGSASNPLLNFTGSTLTLGAGVKLNWANLPNDVADSGDIPDDNYITNITKNTITTEYINAKGITASYVSAEGIQAGTIRGCDFYQTSTYHGYGDTEIRGGRVQFVKGSECYGVLCGGDTDKKMWVQGINALKLDCTEGHISMTPQPSGGKIYLSGTVVIMGGAKALQDSTGKPIGGGSAYFG